MIRRKNNPKYLQLAKTLAKRIASDDYPIGTLLPTETVLMDEFGLSRQTVRQAIGLLKEWGMASTRHGSGSAVLSKGNDDGYIQKFGTLAELLQHDAQTQIQYRESEKIVVDQELADLIGCAPNQTFWRLTVLRRLKETGMATSYVDLYIRDSHRQIIDLIGNSPNQMIHTLLEEGYGERITRIDQEITAALMPDGAADALNVAKGQVGMRAIRRYFGSHNRLIWTGVNYHPADRFTYKASLLRDI
ncbi:MAG: GntR family transcriptional regulator [Sneathiella sp.]|nr:GntR family transcriptional regulator [Sneathiella sp.]